MKKIIFAVVLLLVVLFLSRNLNPFASTMFDFHDETQPARIQQFVLNLKNFQIPPRIAPDFSFKLGFPVFNYYSPFSYWVTSAINLLGIAIAPTLKISFLLSIIVGFIFMFKFTGLFFDFYPSLLAAVLYITSPWLAVEIFIRGDMAEAWFIALFPAALWALYKDQSSKSHWFFLLTIFIVSFTLTAHNILSLVFLPLVLIYVFFLPNKKKGVMTIISALFLSAYFFIPALTELAQTHALTIITKNTGYLDQALCWKQLWTSAWGYGLSFKGCEDGLSFMLGKPQIILGILGFLIFLLEVFFIKTKKYKNSLIIFFIIFFSLSAIFITTNSAIFIDKIFLPIFSLFQFPWRFLTFGLFGLAFLAGAIKAPKILKKITPVGFVALAIVIVVYNSKFFTKHNLTLNKFNNDTLNPAYINWAIAYKVSEYLPSSVDYKKWLLLEPKQDKSEKRDFTLEDNRFVHGFDQGEINIQQDTPFFKQAMVNSKKIIINISYLPYWRITINNKNVVPDKFDYLGRPLLDLKEPSVIMVKYEQTLIEKFGNIISIITLFGLIIFIKSKVKSDFVIPAKRIRTKNGSSLI